MTILKGKIRPDVDQALDREDVELRATQLVELGDYEGHPFRGNQWQSVGSATAMEGLTPDEQVRVNPETGNLETKYGRLITEGTGAKETADIFQEQYLDYLIMTRDHVVPGGTPEAREEAKVILERELTPALSLNNFEWLPRNLTLKEPGGDRDARVTAIARAERDGVRGYVVHANGSHNFMTLDQARQVKRPESMFGVQQLVELGDYEGHPFRGNQWTDGVDAGERLESAIDRAVKLSGEGKGPLVRSASEALERLAAGEPVQLPADQVSALLDKIQEAAQDAKERGEAAPNINLCNLTVPDTNLFCAETVGIPRVQMPQLAGQLADGTEVDRTQEFEERLRDLGHVTTETNVIASHLKATQGELAGPIVASIMGSLERGEFEPKQIFVSSDNFILDGHHTWAAVVGEDYDDARADSLTVPVVQVDAPILQLLGLARSFSEEQGIAPQTTVKPATVAAADGGSVGGMDTNDIDVDEVLDHELELSDTVAGDLEERVAALELAVVRLASREF